MTEKINYIGRYKIWKMKYLSLFICLFGNLHLLTAQITILQLSDVIYYNTLEENGVIAILNKDESPLTKGQYRLLLATNEFMEFSVNQWGNIEGKLTYSYHDGKPDEQRYLANFQNGKANEITTFNPSENKQVYLLHKDEETIYIRIKIDGNIIQEMQESRQTRAGFLKSYLNNQLLEEEITKKNGERIYRKYSPEGTLVLLEEYKKKGSQIIYYDEISGKKKSEHTSNNRGDITDRKYYENGILKNEHIRTVGDPNNEINREYDHKGNLIRETIGNYPKSIVRTYDEDGNLVDDQQIKNNNLTNVPTENISDAIPAEEFIAKVVVDAEYPGGINELYKYVYQHYDYPVKAKLKNIQGTAKVKFTVDVEGNLTQIEPLSNLGYGIEEEFVLTLQNNPKKMDTGKRRKRKFGRM